MQESGEIAAEKIRQAGRKSIKEYAIQSFFTAAWFVVLTVVVQYFMFFDDFKPGGWFYERIARVKNIENTLEMLQYNQTTPGANYTHWDWEAFWETWQNQDKYIREQRGQ